MKFANMTLLATPVAFSSTQTIITRIDHYFDASIAVDDNFITRDPLHHENKQLSRKLQEISDALNSTHGQ